MTRGQILKLLGLGGLRCLSYALSIEGLSWLYPIARRDVALGVSLAGLILLFTLAIALGMGLMLLGQRAWLLCLPLALPSWALLDLYTIYPHRALAYALLAWGLYSGFVLLALRVRARRA